MNELVNKYKTQKLEMIDYVYENPGLRRTNFVCKHCRSKSRHTKTLFNNGQTQYEMKCPRCAQSKYRR